MKIEAVRQLDDAKQQHLCANSCINDDFVSDEQLISSETDSVESSTTPFRSFATEAIHAGADPDMWQQNQIVPCISVATTYRKPSPASHACGVYDYSRTRNPTRDALQNCLAAIEASKYCAVFSSGTAAMASIINIVHSGGHIICTDVVYAGTRQLLDQIATSRHGIEVTYVDATRVEEVVKRIRPNTKLVWVESLSNPHLHVHDIAALSGSIKNIRADIVLGVDNSTLSPYFLRPLSLGADIVMHSVSKYINGHSDVIMGAVLVDNDDLGREFTAQQKLAGAVTSPFDCYLAIRGIKTLAVRMQAHEKNAHAVARALERNGRVKKVLFPGLPSHPGHSIHFQQARGMSGMLAFYLANDSKEAATLFLTALKVVALATSLGGVGSLAEAPALSSAAAISKEERARLGLSDGLIRLSVGLEDIEDVIEDLEQALAMV